MFASNEPAGRSDTPYSMRACANRSSITTMQRCRTLEDFAQFAAWAHAFAVRLGDELVTIFAQKLPSEFTPECVDDGAVGLAVGFCRSNIRADQDRSACLGNRINSCFLQYTIHSC